MTQEKFQEFVIEQLSNVRENISNLESKVSDVKEDIAYIKGKLDTKSINFGMTTTLITLVIALAALVKSFWG